jgi:hypothetical protein
MMQPTTEPTHIAYADETHHNVGRYRGIGLVSLMYEHTSNIGESLRSLIQNSGIAEFKWQKLDSKTDRKAALKMLHYAIDKACAGVLRLDVLTWDIQDKRHRVQGRNDTANLERMYYHLFRNVLRARWPNDAVWRLCPDEHSGMRWDKVAGFLGIASTRLDTRQDLFSQEGFNMRLRQEFGIEQILPCQSHKESLIQLADLFVGLAAYSRGCYERYQEWERTCGQQPSLFTVETTMPIKLSRSDHERCAVLAELDAIRKRRRLGVSLKTNQGLKTFDPANPINFWWYEPQHEEDKAPVKSQREAKPLL